MSTQTDNPQTTDHARLGRVLGLARGQRDC